ncbi:DUF1156 domain-containing protein [Micromonospora globbae]|uniref:DUF1156 domain-containing protein n=1 Tax=Micromonospora globbae TaxID=1894969 RepID=A0A420EVD0_9ACTN|nr:DUF1156 domain-containing protein [Micromonospora globbae]RKF24685.1 DUF1156 domain-containing protein [Micromonospora globbae]
MKRKLIEVALPLETINRESAREKEPFTRNHPRSLHIWWARRPHTAARAVLFAQLVDDPSARPEEFPTDEAQRAERERLHALIRRMSVWEASWNDPSVWTAAHREIVKSSDGNPPRIFDPFAGGGTIPLEAQRLGLEAYASDLNPVAVLINKALVEIPPRFRDQLPVFPGVAESKTTWMGAEGLAADVRAYGTWMREEAERRIGKLYPEATFPDGSKGPVTAWIWARTVTCANPACGIEMPLVRSWWLSKKTGKEAYIVPSVVADPAHASKLRVEFAIDHDPAKGPAGASDGTVGRTGATCLACHASVDLKYVRAEGQKGRLRQQLMAVVAEGRRQRIYLPPTPDQVEAAVVDQPTDIPDAGIPPKAPSFRVQAYGMTKWTDLFTNRQLAALATFSDLVGEARDRIERDALAAGQQEGPRLESDGNGAAAYADAVATYLGLAVSRYADLSNAICSWNQTNENVRALFARQAVPMAWDFVEACPFGQVSIAGPIESAAASISLVGPDGSSARQQPAQAADFSEAVLSTDPPYYDNIGYSDLSDFFYVWQRRALRAIHPKLLSTMLVPKSEELVANQYRHHGKEGAKAFFEDGFRNVFTQARSSARADYPITVYYAFKQSEDSNEGTSSSGWETLLDGMIKSGWSITSTWPIRSERSTRAVGLGTNALASSIVLSLRPRPDDAPTTDRRGLISALQAELPDALRRLQQAAIAPVDLPQAAIGPGMAVFSRYAKVLEPDGSRMTVRSALARINEILDQVVGEQEGDFDPTTRFAIAWYRQHGYNTGTFGDADNLARARNTSVERMDRDAILTSRAGKVTLIRPADTPADYDVLADEHTSTWEVLHHTIRILETEGVPAAGAFLATTQSRPDGAIDLDLVKELAFLLFSVAEKNGWAKDAISFNAVAQSWGDVVDASKAAPAAHEQGEFDFSAEDD